jgi:replicative superfamily II helicase
MKFKKQPKIRKHKEIFAVYAKVETETFDEGDVIHFWPTRKLAIKDAGEIDASGELVGVKDWF